jgi:FkbM family methyltransferase
MEDAELAKSFEVMEIEVFGHPVRLPCLPQYRKFYAKLKSGTWEARTFEVLSANVDKSINYIDVGAWIGVTAFWASRLAKSVLAVEPDPRCNEILKELSPHYPNVMVLSGALSPEPTVRINAVSGFGSSEASALDIGDGETVVVPGYSIADLMERAGPGPVFVKIDIEGYEYKIMAEIAKLANHELRGLQCAVHPQLFERSLKGPWVLRRLRGLIETYRLSRILPRHCRFAAVPRYRNLASYMVLGILFRRIPKGTDFLFLKSPPISTAS